MRTGMLAVLAGGALAGGAVAQEAGTPSQRLRVGPGEPTRNQDRAAPTDAERASEERNAVFGRTGGPRRAAVQDELRALIRAGHLQEEAVFLVLPEEDGAGGFLSDQPVETNDPAGAHYGVGRQGSALPGARTALATAPFNPLNLGSVVEFVDDFSTYNAWDASTPLPLQGGPADGAIRNAVDPRGAVWFHTNNFQNTEPQSGMIVNVADPGLPADAPTVDASGFAGGVIFDPPGPGIILDPAGQMFGRMAVRAVQESTSGRSPDVLFSNSDSPNITDPELFSPTVSSPAIMGYDWYAATDIITSQNFSTASLAEGLFTLRTWFGGVDRFDGDLGEDGRGVMVNFVSLGPLAGSPASGAFYVSPTLEARPDQWTSMLHYLTLNGLAGFVRNADTDGTNGITIIDGRFPGLETGWADIYPGRPGDCLSGGCVGADGVAGTADDTAYDGVTSGAYLGVGRTATDLGVEAPNAGAAGDFVAPFFAGAALDNFRLRHGFEHSFTDRPALQFFTDWYADNRIIVGQFFTEPEPRADGAIPFRDDLERLTPGPLEFQGAPWQSGIGANAIVSTLFNHTTGVGSQVDPAASNFNNPLQSIVEVNSPGNGANIFTQLFQTTTPLATADPDAGIPAQLGAFFRISEATNVRALDIGDLSFIYFGNEDPATRMTDDRMYVRQPNINLGGAFNYHPQPFNPGAPEDPNQIHFSSTAQAAKIAAEGGVFNDNFWNTEAMQAGGVPFVYPLNTFFGVYVEKTGVVVAEDGEGNPLFAMRLFVNGVINQNGTPDDGTSGNPVGVDRADDFWSGGTQLFPLGDTANAWVSRNNELNEFDIWSGLSENGAGQEFVVDDLLVTGVPFNRGAGPSFSLPYLDAFADADYASNAEGADDIGGQGASTILDTAELDELNLTTYFDSTLTLNPGDGPVCRYLVNDVLFDAGGFAGHGVGAGGVIAVLDELFPPPNPAADECPGNLIANIGRVEVFADKQQDISLGGVILAVGRWQLLNDVPGDTVQAGDVTGYRFNFFGDDLWDTAGLQPVVEDGPEFVLNPASPGRLDGPGNDDAVNPMARGRVIGFFSNEFNESFITTIETRVPLAPRPRPAWVAGQTARISANMFVDEVVDPRTGLPFPDPLTRVGLQPEGTVTGDLDEESDYGRVLFGGPDLVFNGQGVPPDRVSLSVLNPNFDPFAPVDPFRPVNQFEEFPAVFRGGAPAFAVHGQWFATGMEADLDTQELRFFYKPDLTDPRDLFDPAFEIRQEGATFVGIENVNVEFSDVITPRRLRGFTHLDIRDDGFQGSRGQLPHPKLVLEGAREGTASDPSMLPLPTGVNPWEVAPPIDPVTGLALDPITDWCFYEVDSFEDVIIAGGRFDVIPTAPLVQEVDPLDGIDDLDDLEGDGDFLFSPRAIEVDDVIAVPRRDPHRVLAGGKTFGDFVFQTNPPMVAADINPTPVLAGGALFGDESPLVFNCPAALAGAVDDDDGFIFIGPSGDELFRGEHTDLGGSGINAITNPAPGGGIANPTPPYNAPDFGDPAEVDGFRDILLGQFRVIGDPPPDVDAQTYFVDNIRVSEECPAVGPTMLANLLANWRSPFGPTDLAGLLANWRRDGCEILD